MWTLKSVSRVLEGVREVSLFCAQEVSPAASALCSVPRP